MCRILAHQNEWTGVFFATWLALSAPASAAETLVKSLGTHAYAPGLAKSWTATPQGAAFQLGDGVTGAPLVRLLNERLAGVHATLDGSILVVTGLPMPVLLERLAALPLEDDADALSELGGLSGPIATTTAEGGGSIRVGRTMDVPHAPLDGEVDPHECIEATIVAVQRGEFPLVTLKVRINRSVEAGPLQKTLHKGQVIELSVMFSGSTKPLDLSIERNRRNLGAYYAAVGDRVSVHPSLEKIGEAVRISADWLERR